MISWITLDDERGHPLSEPARWAGSYTNRQCRTRRLFDRAAPFAEGQGARGRGPSPRYARNFKSHISDFKF
jgi:hypothetical protein